MGTALGNGVIGNTAVSGTVIQGSSPCSPTKSSVLAFEDLRSAGVFFFVPMHTAGRLASVSEETPNISPIA